MVWRAVKDIAIFSPSPNVEIFLPVSDGQQFLAGFDNGISPCRGFGAINKGTLSPGAGGKPKSAGSWLLSK
jgi:hypothetical protein